MLQSILLKFLSLFTITLLLGTTIKAQNTFEFKKRIASSTDDAEERQTGGTMDITSSDIELVYDGSTAGNQTVGLRFTNISIPKDAVIVNAYIQFAVDENTHTGATSVSIYAEDADNSAAFSASGYNISNRVKTSNSVAWNNIPLWTVLNDVSADQRTPDIKQLLKDVMSRSGWSTGNSITILITGTGRRNAHAYDGNAGLAPELVIEYKLKKAPIQNFPLSKNSVWMYNDSGQNLGSTWTQNGFIDTAWPFYLGKFGYGEGNERTLLQYGANPNNKFVTTYFRTNINITDSSKLDSLIFGILADDGAVVYVNGDEVFRHNMPNGTITYNTTAIASIQGSDESYYFEYRIGKRLRNGINTIAVEVHQCDPESSDKGFDMTISSKKPPMATVNFPLAKGSEWYYNDKGLNLYGSNWTDENYSGEVIWDYGKAPLGYGDAMTTTIGYGPNSANKHIAYYFRKKINIQDTSKINAYALDFNIRRDDAAVVYVNGVEVLRQNIDTGKLNHRSISQSIVDGTNETTYFTTTISKSFFKNGINQIAVAIHQRDSVSSDLGFDMEIVPKLKPNPAAMGCVDGDKHIACFNSIAPTAQVNNLIIPKASHSFQQLLKQGTPYTLISGNVPGNPDFTAYVPRNGSSVDGVVAINHENSPGGVSLAYVRYIDSTQLWTIDSTKRVDLYNSDLVSTVRNCSGGITPWGTVITSEESVSSADANADGYFDIGWNVEFNPWTGKVMEYGNGKQEKLWGLGRMNHENVVVANDSMTVYQGEDGGTHLVYKFVADKKMDLSKGKLYVLKLDQALVSGEPTGTTGRWIRVPNTTQADRNNCNSLALSLGGTQFSGVEDVEIGTIDGKIYFTAKGLNRVYRFKDADTTFTEFETFVGGKSYAINTGTTNVMEPWGSGNDNLTFDDKGNLWVLQDGSRNYMWLVRPDHTQAEPKIELFMSPSLGAEPTGMTFTPDYKFMFMSIQHPSSSNVSQIDASGNSIDFKSAATIVVSRKEYLGIMAPEADFVADTLRTRVGNPINFEDISFPKITGRVWNFKGAVDTFSNALKPSVNYANPGKYEVSLIANNKKGADTLVRKNYVEVIPGLPVADFSADKVSIFEGETVRLSDLSNGLVEFRNWKLNGSDINMIDSSFNLKLNEMGTYSIELYVGNYGDTVKKLKSSYITVKRRKPIADFSISKSIVSLNEKVKLVDLSLNKIESRKWSAPSSIGLTSTTDSVVELSYNRVGTYDIYLIVANAGGSDTLEKLKSIKVIPFVPKADFKVSSNLIPRGDTIVLTDLSINGVDQRKWTVQGATFIGNSNDSVIKVKFMSAGVYSVKLWVSNEAGKDSLLKQAHITVGPLRPVADFTASQTTITKNNSIVFTDLSAENISKRSWIFSGGVPSVGSDSNESVSYPVTGKYNVQLTVSNASGSKTMLKSAYVTVNPSTGIESLKDLANLSIYPNPVVNNVNLELELFETTELSVELTDISGKTLKVFVDKESHNGMQTLTFNVDDLNLMPGVYVLKIKIGDEVISRKIVKS